MEIWVFQKTCVKIEKHSIPIPSKGKKVETWSKSDTSPSMGENKPHVRGPPLCVSQWDAGKNEFMAKSFFAKNHMKITKFRPFPHYRGMGKTVKIWSAIDKNEFWGKFFLKISKSLLLPRGQIWP